MARKKKEKKTPDQKYNITYTYTHCCECEKRQAENNELKAELEKLKEDHKRTAITQVALLEMLVQKCGGLTRQGVNL